MSRNETVIDAPADEVFRELVQPENFAYWVIGSKHIRGVDDGWPAEGSVFHHAVGLGPLHIEDHTEVVEIDEPRRLVLRASFRPLGSAVVRLLLEPRDGSTRVVMEEEPHEGPAKLLPDVVVHALSGMRNVGSLQRLKRLVESGQEPHELTVRHPIADERHPVLRSPLVPGLLAAAAASAAAYGVVRLVRRRRRGR